MYMVELLKPKLTKLCSSPTVGFCLELLTLRDVHVELPGVHQLQFRFSYPGICSHGSCVCLLWKIRILHFLLSDSPVLQAILS